MQKQDKLASFEEPILPHLDAAYNLAHWLTRGDTDAEDVVQEFYLRHSSPSAVSLARTGARGCWRLREIPATRGWSVTNHRPEEVLS